MTWRCLDCPKPATNGFFCDDHPRRRGGKRGRVFVVISASTAGLRRDLTRPREALS